jgi:hypothetical protein
MRASAVGERAIAQPRAHTHSNIHGDNKNMEPITYTDTYTHARANNDALTHVYNTHTTYSRTKQTR